MYSIINKETQKERETRKTKIQEYLTDAKLPKIQAEQLIELEEPITQDEIKKALKETPIGKSPGPDGFTIKYYKEFQNQLIPKLCNYLNKIRESEEIRR